MRYEVTVDGHTYQVEINEEGHITIDGQTVEVDFAQIGNSGLYSLLVDNESFEALVEPRENIWLVLLRGDLYEVDVVDERVRLLRARASLTVPESGEVTIRAPMPGLVVSVPVEMGQEVSKGDNLVILESMKMENELKAPRDGRIERINIKAGDSVERDQILVVIS
ncbi:MAG TPA: biotin/lipoyl-binding protein [Chloroflexi bacterium]|nr:biotin/lipoyl-binding protein [Chloroflexota bacterium]